jgi:hypothetical protein
MTLKYFEPVMFFQSFCTPRYVSLMEHNLCDFLNTNQQRPIIMAYKLGAEPPFSTILVVKLIVLTKKIIWYISHNPYI